MKPYPGKPDVRNFRGDAGNVVYGGIAHPPAIERAGSDKPPPKDARASVLPDRNPKPMMNGMEKSDPAIVAEKPTNKGTRVPAESVEPRAGPEGNLGSQSTRRTQGRGSVSQAVDWIRQYVRREPRERLTALLHHVTVDTLCSLPRHLGGEVSQGRRLPGEGPGGAARLLRLPGGALAEPADDEPHRVDLRHDTTENGEDQELPEREDGAEPRAPTRHERPEAMAPPTRLPSTGLCARWREVH